MDRFLPVESSLPVSHPMPLSGDGMAMVPRLAPPFMPRDQDALSPASAQATSQNGFPNGPDPPLYLTGSNQTAYSAWNHILASNSDIGHSPLPIPGPSESSAHGSHQASGYDVVIADAHSILTNEREQEIPHISPSAPTHGPTPPVNLCPEHVVFWYLTCRDAVVINGPHTFVPQSIYQPHSQGDRERYVSLARLHPPIIFFVQDSPEWGIPVQHLLSRQVTRLVGGNEPAFTSCGPSIGIRMQWLGYQPYHKQVSTRDYTFERRMINKAKLAKVVARFIKQFMDTMSGQAMQVGSDRRWKVGPSDITVNDIVLVSLHHVSQGSWQPQLRLRRTIGNNVTAGPQNHHGP